jgi:abortive infection bacteriophage resistance protein
MEFTKPPLKIEDQINLLKARGMKIPDVARAEHYLKNISYYRMRAYMMPFQNPDDPEHKFEEGTTFDHVLNLYVFDRELRLLVFDAIERIEVALRTQIIHQFAITYGSHWFEDSAIYRSNHHYGKNLTKLDEEINRSNEVFIKHYQNKYTKPKRPPAWMSLEVTTMGLLSKIFQNLKDTGEKKKIADHFMLGHPKVLESWMHSISYIRNICAHHSRLWNRTLTIRPTLPNVTKQSWLNSNDTVVDNKIYAVLCCIYYMMKVVNPTTSFKVGLQNLFTEYPQVDISRMGFDKNWSEEPLWSQKQ